MFAATVVLLVVAVVLLCAAGVGWSFWLSDSRRRRALFRDNEAS
jgi:flagellar basal body-associated protein FliL